jgi:hexaprenyl-diphosphate synthase
MRAAIAAAVTSANNSSSSTSATSLLGNDAALARVSQAAFDMYVRKTFYKTASLMANSCRAIAVLGGYPDDVAEAAYRYGVHLGMAFQLIDDLLDYEGQTAKMGKPVLADLKQGLATAPVLFAAQRFPVLLPCIERKFEAPGDIDLALQLVAKADGLTTTRRLAVAHGQKALDSLNILTPGPARTALAALVTLVLKRNN